MAFARARAVIEVLEQCSDYISRSSCANCIYCGNHLIRSSADNEAPLVSDLSYITAARCWYFERYDRCYLCGLLPICAKCITDNGEKIMMTYGITFSLRDRVREIVLKSREDFTFVPIVCEPKYEKMFAFRLIIAIWMTLVKDWFDAQANDIVKKKILSSFRLAMDHWKKLFANIQASDIETLIASRHRKSIIIREIGGPLFQDYIARCSRVDGRIIAMQLLRNVERSDLSRALTWIIDNDRAPIMFDCARVDESAKVCAAIRIVC